MIISTMYERTKLCFCLLSIENCKVCQKSLEFHTSQRIVSNRGSTLPKVCSRIPERKLISSLGRERFLLPIIQEHVRITKSDKRFILENKNMSWDWYCQKRNAKFVTDLICLYFKYIFFIAANNFQLCINDVGERAEKVVVPHIAQIGSKSSIMGV